jgi:hypothetical protein
VNGCSLDPPGGKSSLRPCNKNVSRRSRRSRESRTRGQCLSCPARRDCGIRPPLETADWQLVRPACCLNLVRIIQRSSRPDKFRLILGRARLLISERRISRSGSMPTWVLLRSRAVKLAELGVSDSNDSDKTRVKNSSPGSCCKEAAHVMEWFRRVKAIAREIQRRQIVTANRKRLSDRLKRD